MLTLMHKVVKIAKEEGPLILLRKSLKFMKYKLNLNENLYRLLLPYAIWKIKRVQFNSLEELVEFSFNWLLGIIRPMQIKEEILQLLRILAEKRPKVILEIGTANGGTLFLFTRVASDDAIIISIDLPGGKFGGGYPDWRVPLYKSFARKNQQIHLIRANSHDPETFEKVKRILNGRKVDFLFIDGDHTYEGVKKDFEMYSKLVAEKESIIALHDIVHHPSVPECQVEKFWREIKHKFRTKEIISSKNQTWAGIGIILN